MKYRFEEYGKIKYIKIGQDEYGGVRIVGMVCFETKEEANAAIQDLNEATRYIVKECEPKKQRKILTTKIKLTPTGQSKKSKKATN